MPVEELSFENVEIFIFRGFIHIFFVLHILRYFFFELHSFGDNPMATLNYSAAEIQLINSGSGLFIEDIGYLNFYESEWNIIFGMNLSYYAEEIQNLKVIVRSILSVKLKIDGIPMKYRLYESIEILDELVNMLEDVEKYNHEWFASNKDNQG